MDPIPPAASAAPARRRFNPWPICIMAYFAVAIIGCVTGIVLCSRHPADLVARDYYEQELRYQRQFERLQHAQMRTQLAAVTYNGEQRLIRITLPPDQAGSHSTGSIELYRPAAVDQDQHLRLEPDAQGVQTIDARHLQPGLWKVRVSWTANGEDYYLDQKVVVGSAGREGAGHEAPKEPARMQGPR